MKITARFWIGIAVLTVLSPLGFILPAHFKAGSAWGEWGPGEMRKLVGYIPRGLEKLSGLWSALMPGYAFKGWEAKGLFHLCFGYVLSAILGTAVIVIVVTWIGKLLVKKGDSSDTLIRGARNP